MLPGDLIMQMIQRADPSINRDLFPAPEVGALDQGGTDPGNIAEFLAYEIPFEVEPATGLIFPADVDRG
jgi:hypothetical protein